MRKLMKIFVVLICSVALVNVAYGAQPEENKQQKKKQPQTVQHAPPRTTGHATGAGAGPKKTSTGGYEAKKGQTSMGQYEGQKGKKGQTPMEANQGQKGKKGQAPMEANQGQKGKKGQTPMQANQGQKGKAAKGGKVTGATAATGKPFKPHKFNLPQQPNTAKAPPVKFQQGKHIQGSQNWQGQQ